MFHISFKSKARSINHTLQSGQALTTKTMADINYTLNPYYYEVDLKMIYVKFVHDINVSNTDGFDCTLANSMHDSFEEKMNFLNALI